MKFINKKTGEILVCGEGIIEFKTFGCKNFAEFLKLGWEDYKPAEPLIKDEKIRKAVRAWAEANDITQVIHDAGWNAFRCTDFVIAFDYDFDRHDGLEDMKSYTIAELCGKDEE